jgi:hypothetical protein
MKTLLLATFLIFLQFSFTHTNKSKAEAAVMKNLKKLNAYYEPLEFSEFFDQTYPKLIQEKLKTKKKIKYSIIQSYVTQAGKFSNVYFHLSSSYAVVGSLTDQEMTEIMMQVAGPKIDSITNFLGDSLMKAMEKK